MRNTCSSWSTRRSVSLIAWFDCRSCPSGFSSTTRVAGPFRPTAAICSHTVVNRLGAVATYITTDAAPRAFSISARRV